MACTVHPTETVPLPTSIERVDPGPADQPVPRLTLVRAVAPPMTRCECAEISFEQVAQTMGAESLSFEEVSRRTGCGRNCGACLPDLRRYLASR
jgi:bacterioferritin-associated ferredoxin